MTLDLHQTLTIARELRGVRENPPATVGEAMRRYAKVLRKARERGVDTPGLLLIGELIWIAVRPEEEPAPDAIGAALEEFWKKHDDDLAFLRGQG
jgi:hypothetical protein